MFCIGIHSSGSHSKNASLLLNSIESRTPHTCAILKNFYDLSLDHNFVLNSFFGCLLFVSFRFNGVWVLNAHIFNGCRTPSSYPRRVNEGNPDFFKQFEFIYFWKIICDERPSFE